MLTFDQLVQASRDICIDDSGESFSGLTDTNTFIRREINNTIRYIHSLMREYKLQPPSFNFDTEAGEIYYRKPIGLVSFETVTVKVGAITYPLKSVESQQRWNELQQVFLNGGIPQYYFVRKNDFGVFPTPGDEYEGVIEGNYQPIPLTESDFSSGTVDVENIDGGDNNGLGEITSSEGDFTADMEGRWFALTNDNNEVISNWYQIGEFVDVNTLVLTDPFIDGYQTGADYIIAQIPDMPSGLHEFIPYRVGSIYYRTKRKDAEQSRALLNFFYTGDFESRKRTKADGGILGELRMIRERGRDNSSLVETRGRTNSADNFFKSGIWGLELSE